MLETEQILKIIDDYTVPSRVKTGIRYYEGKHDIKDYRIFFFDADGQLIEDVNRTNVKISHPFFTELVDQQVQYMLSNKDDYVQANDANLQSKLLKVFDDEFISELSDLLQGVIIKGSDYMYLYKNKNGNICFKYAEQENVIELSAKESPDKEAHVIYFYSEQKGVTNIQVWSANCVEYFVRNGNKIEVDPEHPNPEHHISKKEGKGENFSCIPFFRMDNNKKRLSNLEPIKDIIDDYDMMSCGFSNNLGDFDNPITLIKGFEGDDLSKLQQNIKTKRIIGVGQGGDLDIKTVQVPYEARLAKMEQDEKNIYRFGMGFNSSQLGDGNITNIVIKSRYVLLDLKSNKLETRLRKFLKGILKIVLEDINSVDGKGYQLSDVWFDFTREVMTNALDNAQIEQIEANTKQTTINTLMTIAEKIDDKTLLKKLCDVLDIDINEVKPPEDEIKEAYEDIDKVDTNDEQGAENGSESKD